MFLQLFLIAIALLGLAFVGFATRMLLIKGGKFPQTEIGKNSAMRKLGITCARCEELKNCKSAGQI